MATISLCMIVKNEATTLARCLDNARSFADEIIVVDTGSSDDSKAIARRYTDQVFDFTWCDDFAAARNFSYAQANGDYIMYLDADERIAPEDQEKIARLKATFHEKAIMLRLHKPELGVEFASLRFVRRDAGFRWQGIVHEHLSLADGHPLADSDMGFIDVVITHHHPGPLNLQRNIRLMDLLTEETLIGNFWLCAQCFLECTLAGETAKAERYAALVSASRTPFPFRADTYKLIHDVLKHFGKSAALFRWNMMYLKDKRQWEASQKARPQR